MTRLPASQLQAPAHGPRRARRQAVLSLWMLAFFAAWTAAFVGLSGRVADALGQPTAGGDVVYLEAWVPWIAVTVLWVLPLLVGFALALVSGRHGGGSLARVGLVVNGVLVVLLVGPSLADRFVNR
jgi:hypothetical protein